MPAAGVLGSETWPAQGGGAAMPPTLQQATKMMSRRKILLLVLGCGSLSLLIHQGAQLSW